MPKGLVALTGATGFIGNEILQSLVENGYAVNALTRKPQQQIKSVNWIEGSLDNTNSLQQLVSKASAIIHCAGRVRGNSRTAFTETNVKGTINLVQAVVQKTKKPRFLFISSLAARNPELSWYAQSKHLAEQSLTKYSENIKLTVFRPTAVYGPGDKEIRPIFQATRHGILPVIGKTSNHFSLLHVNDFVTAVKCWLESDADTNGTFELCDSEPEGYSYQSVATIAAEVWRHPVRCISVPIFLVNLAAHANLWLSRFFQYAPMLTPGKVRELQHPNWLCDNKPLRTALPSWYPSVKLRHALPQLSL